MIIRIPENVEYIINTLSENGYEAYAVGGCVRDSILGRIPGDWDITTSAKPEAVKAIFRRTVDTGIEHGTVTVMIGKEGYEVTTYRIDGEYEDNRHPKEVEFTSNLVEDLKRRDFTINAMAYNPETGIVDEFDGLSDIEKKVIRCVGKPEDRFDEDALRILRAIRFAGQLGFVIEEQTEKAIIAKADHLRNISAERIRVELNKLIISKHPERLIDGYQLGITEVVLPEFNRMLETEQNSIHHCYDVGRHSIEAIKAVERLAKADESVGEKEKSILAWTMLLHDTGKPMTKTTDEEGKDHFYGHAPESEKIAKMVLRRLKFDNYTIDTVCRLVHFHDYRIQPKDTAVRRAMNKIGKDYMPLFFLVQQADVYGQHPDTREEKLNRIAQVYEKYEEVLKKEQCVSIKELKVNGSDLIQIGFKPGKILGQTLQELLDIVLEHPEYNEKETLLGLARERL